MRSFKTHLSKVADNVKLSFEELTTIILVQIERYVNSRPLDALRCGNNGVAALTPGHLLIGYPLEALPDSSFSYQKFSPPSLAPVSSSSAALLAEVVPYISRYSPEVY